jgi:excisionase family DNA binding protein
MDNSEYVSIPEMARILGLSRIAVYRKVRKGQIKAKKIGRNYAIDRGDVEQILGKALAEEDKRQIDAAVSKTVKEYGRTLKLLGAE